MTAESAEAKLTVKAVVEREDTSLTAVVFESVIKTSGIVV